MTDYSKSKFSPFLNPLCVALDVDTAEQAMQIVHLLNPQKIQSTFSNAIQDANPNTILNSNLAGGFKLGPRLLLKYGQSFIQEVAQYAPVFVDCKFFDITSTTVAAVRSSFEAGASVVTVHALNGKECLQALAKLEKELNQIRPFKILCVTILTSWSQGSFAFPASTADKTSRVLTSTIVATAISDQVVDLARLVIESGLSGMVSSAEELKSLTQLQSLTQSPLFFLTPGIRLPEDDTQDQARVMGPQQAIQAGSSCLVVGRPILQAQDPRGKAQQFLNLIQQ
jgi:orotidine-5'-phosphate decarboxylase